MGHCVCQCPNDTRDRPKLHVLSEISAFFRRIEREVLLSVPAKFTSHYLLPVENRIFAPSLGVPGIQAAFFTIITSISI